MEDHGSDHTGGLIVGAVPTGLVLAITLQQAGVKRVLIDKLAHGQNASRAPVIGAHTLRCSRAQRFSSVGRARLKVANGRRLRSIARLMAINFLPRKS
jgi:2-polyprenyl-6-methoxyphenol hydroxylase-like FAD-dependent oxidoreductase